MRKHGLLTIGLTAALLASAALATADDISLSLIPISGSISGLPGSTVGWGYTITNNTAEWIQTLNLSADSFLNGTPNNIFDFPAVAPTSSVTLDFSLVATASCPAPPCGLYELTWDATAPAGFVNSGMFTVSSDYFDQDPANPGAVDLGPAPDASASYSASVPSSSVPEPSGFLLLLTALAGTALWRIKIRSLP